MLTLWFLVIKLGKITNEAMIFDFLHPNISYSFISIGWFIVNIGGSPLTNTQKLAATGCLSKTTPLPSAPMDCWRRSPRLFRCQKWPTEYVIDLSKAVRDFKGKEESRERAPVSQQRLIHQRESGGLQPRSTIDVTLCLRRGWWIATDTWATWIASTSWT